MGRDFQINGDLVCGISIGRHNNYLSYAILNYHSCEKAIRELLDLLPKENENLIEEKEEEEEEDRLSQTDINDIYEAILAFSYTLTQHCTISQMSYD